MKTVLTELLETSIDEKEKRGILYTPSEISGQVDLWQTTLERFESMLDDISPFIKRVLEKRTPIICTGAGTSEFIGYCVEGLLRKNLSVPVNVFSTTKIVTSPFDCFIKDGDALLISFARSGNSPESIGAVEIADMVNDGIQHLIITCNKDGNLKKRAAGKQNSLAFCLDESTNDLGLAMTSSFSNMVIAAQMLSYIYNFSDYSRLFGNLVRAGRNILLQAPGVVKKISSLKFDRAVFLGDGGNFGTAVESHLKLQEMTSGSVMCAYDTFPGLRHGPEAVINNRTLVVAFISKDGYRRKYEEDLLKELKEKKIGMAVLTCGSKIEGPLKNFSDYTVEFDPEDKLDITDDLTPPLLVIVGQLLGMFKSLDLGFKPDTPSEGGIINRVVKGVKVYNPLSFRESGTYDIVSER
jgi:tagatose-6-phosphate ketose/aldose isomerase